MRITRSGILQNSAVLGTLASSTTVHGSTGRFLSAARFMAPRLGICARRTLAAFATKVYSGVSGMLLTLETKLFNPLAGAGVSTWVSEFALVGVATGFEG